MNSSVKKALKECFRTKFCIKKTHTFIIIASNFLREQLNKIPGVLILGDKRLIGV